MTSGQEVPADDEEEGNRALTNYYECCRGRLIEDVEVCRRMDEYHEKK